MGGETLWRFVSASVPGSGHLARGTPCQDAHVVQLLDGDVLLVAVADGAGSAPRGEEGAECAVEAVRRHVEREGATGADAEDSLKGLLRGAAESAVNALAAAAGDSPLGDLGTTLLLVVVTPTRLGALQVGDGAIVCRDRRGELMVLSPASENEYINETTFLSSPDMRDHLHLVVTAADHITGIAALTDGMALLALRYPENQAHAPFFHHMFAFASDPASTDEELAEFLGSERVCERTDDDKTLVIAVRHDAA